MRQFTVHMSPYANYTFRILARNLFGMSYPSIHTDIVCTTGPDVPYKNPENVMGEGDLSDNLVIFWTVRIKPRPLATPAWFIPGYTSILQFPLYEHKPTPTLCHSDSNPAGYRTKCQHILLHCHHSCLIL